MGLFNKESCIICGGKTNALTKAKTTSGSVCSSCLSLCSPGLLKISVIKILITSKNILHT